MSDLLTQSVRDIAALSALIAEELFDRLTLHGHKPLDDFRQEHEGACGVAQRVAETAHLLYNLMDGMMQLGQGCDYYTATSTAAEYLVRGRTPEDAALAGHEAGEQDTETNEKAQW